jgi:superfamily I DNA/RNA helicase
MDYTSEQLAIFEFVKSGKGHAMINAVAGAGKTTTIMGCANYVNDLSKTLFCAFNRSIRNEIADKFTRAGMNEITVKTMHRLGFDILMDTRFNGANVSVIEKKMEQILHNDNFIRDYYKQIRTIHNFKADILLSLYDFEKVFSQIDEKNESNNYHLSYYNGFQPIIKKTIDVTIKEAFDKIRLTLTKINFDDVKKTLEYFGCLIPAKVEPSERYTSNNKRPSINSVAKAFFEIFEQLYEVDIYLAEKKLQIDFVDMLYLPAEWNLFPNGRFDFIFVDECQDLSTAQLQIALKHASKKCRIFAVGDPMQSIYGFAGADPSSYDKIRKTLPNVSEFPLTDTFRCPTKIVEMAKKINPIINARKQEEGKITSFENKEKMYEILSPGDLVISRTIKPMTAVILDLICQRKDIDVHRDNRDEFIAFIKSCFPPESRSMVVDKNDKLAIKLFEENIKTYLQSGKNSQHKYVDDRDLYDSIIATMMTWYLEWNDCQTINDVVSKVNTKLASGKDSIRILSVHRAKGLQAKRVFILNHNKMPLTWDDILPWEEEQEQHLLYVAYTRAEEELFLVDAPEERELSLFDTLIG